MSTPKAVTAYMRAMQRRSAKSRWSGMSAAEKTPAIKALRAKRKRKARALRQNVKVSDAPDSAAPNRNQSYEKSQD